MTDRRIRMLVAPVVLLSTLCLAPTARARIVLQATLNAAQEVPPPSGDGHNPNGTATLVFDEAADTIQYQLTVQDLTGPPVAAHIHEGARGQAGPVLITLDQTTLAGTTQALSHEQIDALVEGELYLNVHTATNPAGEIRGQIVLMHGKCDCHTLSRPDFKQCVGAAIKSLAKSARKTSAIKALRKAVKKSSCGRTNGPRKAIACCLHLNPTENIVTDELCAPMPPGPCEALHGTSKGPGSSCFPANPCSPSAGASS